MRQKHSQPEGLALVGWEAGVKCILPTRHLQFSASPGAQTPWDIGKWLKQYADWLAAEAPSPAH